ncbi:hypothetical protein IC232_13865 [Microvirga sp. BT688]|uniref:hypothetical protein n=1 Tax=Microvirga sp. TaxID=1873136 RepID=UPI001684C683|nr:hypothetical protein [Microvirga sp.]MBD2747786.1 hypothetical protein [Microvirga sp.]
MIDDARATTRSLLALVKDDPVQATTGCSTALLGSEQQRQEALNHLVAVPFAVALHLTTHWDDWVRYINTSELWAHRRKKRPNPRPRRDKDHGRVLYLVMEATFAGESGNGYQRGWWYARALEDAFIRNIKPADIPRHIKASGGLKKMYQAAVKNRPRRNPALDPTDSYLDLGDPEPERAEDSQGEKQQKIDNPGQQQDASPGIHDGVSHDQNPRIRHSAALTRKLDEIARRGRTKKLTVIARPSGEEVVLRLPKKSPKKPNASEDWTTYKPWEA